MSSQPEQPAAAAHSSHVYASFGSERPDAEIEAGIAGLNDFSDANIKQIISIAIEFLQSPQVRARQRPDISARCLHSVCVQGTDIVQASSQLCESQSLSSQTVEVWSCAACRQ